MNTRPLGRDGPGLTEIGLGTWAIGGPWDWGWGTQDDKDSLMAIQAALNSGINWIDTAPVYGLGHAERIVGIALKGKRDKVFIATKCGLIWDDRRRVSNNNQPDSIFREVENSLKRLGTDYIDLYQIHWPDPKTAVDESWETLLKLHEQGKIRYAGVSNFNIPLLQECEQRGHVNSLQPPYSLLNRRAEKEVLPWCLDNGTGVVVYSPLQNGLLSGKFNLSRLSKDDWRRRNSYFREPFLSKNLKFTDQITTMAQKYGKTSVHLAIAWVLRHPAVTSAIVGVRNVTQVNEMLEGTGWQIEEEDLDRIDEFHELIYQ